MPRRRRADGDDLPVRDAGDGDPVSAPDRVARVFAGVGLGSLVGIALAGGPGAAAGVVLGVLIAWPEPGPLRKSPPQPPFSTGFVNDAGCYSWMLLAELGEDDEVVSVETVKLKAGETFHGEGGRWKILAVGSEIEIHARYAQYGREG